MGFDKTKILTFESNQTPTLFNLHIACVEEHKCNDMKLLHLIIDNKLT